MSASRGAAKAKGAKGRQAAVASPWRRRGIASLVVGGLVGASVGLWFLAHSSFLSVQRVKVEGAVRSSPQAIRDASGLRQHPAMLTLNAAAVAERVGRLPWVGEVEVHRRWPNRVTLVVRERVPVAAISRDRGGYVLADAAGRLLEDVADPGGLPTVTRVQPLGPVGRTLGRPTSGALKVAAKLPVAFRDQVAGVDVTRGGAVRLRLDTPVVVLLGQPVRLVAKFTAVASVLAGAELHPGDVIDVSVPSTPVIKGP